MADLYTLGEFTIDHVREKDQTQFSKTAGGTAFNAAVHAARKGAERGKGFNKIYVVGCVGSDSNGSSIKAAAAAEGIDTRFLVHSRKPTTQLFIAVNEEGAHQCIRRTGHAEWTLSHRVVKPLPLAEGDFLLAGSSGLVTRCSRLAHLYALQRTKAVNAKFCFDVNMRDGLWQPKKILPALMPFLKGSTVIKIKEHELNAIFGTTRLEDGLKALFSLTLPHAIVFTTLKNATLNEYRGAVLVSSAAPAVMLPVKPLGMGDRFIAEKLLTLIGD